MASLNTSNTGVSNKEVGDIGKVKLQAVKNKPTTIRGNSNNVTARLQFIPETTEKLLEGPEIIRSLHNEHRYLCKLLEILHEQLDAIEEGLTPDYCVMRDVLSCLHDITEKSHHPREDLLFRRVLRVDGALANEISKLLEEHNTIDENANKFSDSLRQVIRIESINNIEEVKQSCETYLFALQSHMELEEQVVFPYIIDLIKEKHWNQRDIDLLGTQEPLFGKKVSRRQQNLYQYFTNRTKIAIEDFALANYVGMGMLTETIGTLSTNLNDIGTLIGKTTDKIIQTDVDTYHRLKKLNNKNTIDYLNASADCLLAGYDAWAACMTDIGTVLHRARKEVSTPYTSQISLFKDITQEQPERRRF